MTPRMAGADIILEASFPTFARPAATSSERMTPLRFVGCLSWLKCKVNGVRRRECEGFRTAIGATVHLGMTRPVQLDSLSERVAMVELAIGVPNRRCA